MTAPNFEEFYTDMADMSILIDNTINSLQEADNYLTVVCDKLNQVGEAGEGLTKVLPDGNTSITVKLLHRNLLFLQHQIRLVIGLTKVNEFRDIVHLRDMFFPYDNDEF